MNPQKTKILVKNIVISSVIICVLIIAYFVFKKDTPIVPLPDGAVDSGTTVDVVDSNVTRSVRELNDLKDAIASVTAIFSQAAFKELEDFSVPVPVEKVGRENPFAITEWKIKIKALEEQTRTR